MLLVEPAGTLCDIFSDWRVLLVCAAVLLFLPAPLLDGYTDLTSVLSPAALVSAPVALAEMITFVLIPAVIVATMTVSGAPRWPWGEWARRMLLSTAYAIIYAGAFGLGVFGVVFPFLTWSATYSHHPGIAIFWVVVGVPLGLLLWAYGGVTWVEVAARKRGALSSAIARVSAQPVDWMLVAVEIFGITLLLNWGVTALENRLQAAFPMSHVASYVSSDLSSIPFVFYGVGWIAAAARDVD